MKGFEPILRTALVVIVGAFLGYTIYYMAIQRKLLYPGAAVPGWDASADIPGLEKIWLEIPEGLVEAWYLPPVSPGQHSFPGLIFFHGNGELIDYWPKTFGDAQELGIGVLLVEYPGYGRSGGKPSKKSISVSALAAYDALLEQPGVDPERIVVYGRSLGGGAACILAEDRPVAALILQSTFSSTTSFARRMLLPGFLVVDKFENVNALRKYPGPVLVFHSESDDLIPFEQAEQLAAAAENSRLVTMDCTHSDCPPDYAQFWAQVEGFLRQNGILNER